MLQFVADLSLDVTSAAANNSLQAIEMTTPMPASELPDWRAAGTYCSAQNVTDCPPLTPTLTVVERHFGDLKNNMADVGVSTTDNCQLHSRPHQPIQCRSFSRPVKRAKQKYLQVPAVSSFHRIFERPRLERRQSQPAAVLHSGCRATVASLHTLQWATMSDCAERVVLADGHQSLPSCNFSGKIRYLPKVPLSSRY